MEVVAVARASLQAWPLCMLRRGGPDGQLRTAEPICLTASRTSHHLPPSQDVSSEHVSPRASAGQTQARVPACWQRPFSPPNVYTVYTGHRCCRRDWFSVPENMTFMTSCPPGIPHTQPSPSAPRRPGQTQASWRRARAPAHPLAGTDCLEQTPPLSCPHKPLIESRSLSVRLCKRE